LLPAQSGYKEVEADTWTGLFAPAKTPKETVSQLHSWFTAAMQAPEVKAKLIVQGLFPIGLCGADFASLFANNLRIFGHGERYPRLIGWFRAK
jgi:tripartite-type tricarboxylate transporter receptor subunit TctC